MIVYGKFEQDGVKILYVVLVSSDTMNAMFLSSANVTETSF